MNEAIVYRYVICDQSTDSSVDMSDIPFEFLSHEEQPACRCMMIEGVYSKGIINIFMSVEMGGGILRQIFKLMVNPIPHVLSMLSAKIATYTYKRAKLILLPYLHVGSCPLPLWIFMENPMPFSCVAEVST